MWQPHWLYLEWGRRTCLAFYSPKVIDRYQLWCRRMLWRRCSARLKNNLRWSWRQFWTHSCLLRNQKASWTVSIRLWKAHSLSNWVCWKCKYSLWSVLWWLGCQFGIFLGRNFRIWYFLWSKRYLYRTFDCYLLKWGWEEWSRQERSNRFEGKCFLCFIF